MPLESTRKPCRSNRLKITVILMLFSCLLQIAPRAFSQESDTPFLHILGVVQDAGFPQAGCFLPHCMPGWEDERLRRGATAIALIDPAANTRYLFEATPNLPAQLYSLEQAYPDSDRILDGIFLTHAHIGHYAGLMFLGIEAMGSSSVPVYAMPRMKSFLEHNGPWSQLVELKNIELQALQHQQQEVFDAVTVTPFLVPHRDEYSETVGYRIEGPGRSALFIPDINKWQDWSVDIRELVQTVDYALLDATFYAEGELGSRDMSQIPHPFVSETMALFADSPAEQRNKIWFIHMNHTNPLLNSNSEESRYVREQGFNIAKEGDQLPL